LAGRLVKVFGLEIAQRMPSFDPELAFVASRGQYNSRILLAQLLHDAARSASPGEIGTSGRPAGATRVLGVTGVDLFIPVLTHVFGEAQLDGPAAVVSSYRLDSQLYGLPPNRELLLDRLVKEAIHELGHTYRLVHCRRHPCVMMSSTYVEDIDQKSDRFCPECQRSVEQVAVQQELLKKHG
jgi:archaemetzincin